MESSNLGRIFRGGVYHGGMSGSKRTLWRVVFWVALAVFVISAGILGYLAYTYWKADSEYNDVAERALDEEQVTAPGTTLADMTVDWDYLRSINSDVVAWVYVPGTRINYPVVQGVDNDEYLHKSFSQDESFGGRGGSIFLDASCAADFMGANSILYGHHMRDGSMFACLSNDLTSQEGFDGARTIYVLTPACNFRYQAFSIIRTNGSDLLAQAAFADDAQRTAYVADKISRSLTTPAEGFPDPVEVKHILTLATCDYQESDGRAVLFANLVDTASPGSSSTGGEVAADEPAAIQDAVNNGAQ